MLHRVLSVLLLALALGQALDAAAFLGDAERGECCPGEGSDEQCPPDCDLCPCCPSVRCVLAPSLQIPLADVATESRAGDAPAALPTADPREILHVPIDLL